MKRTRTQKIRILFADSHPQVREQLVSRLSREPDFQVVGMAANSLQTLEETRSKQPDLLLIDPIMRDGLGLAILRQVCANLPGTVIVVLTAFIDTTLNLQLREMGIKYTMTKGILFSRLAAELRSAVRPSTRFHD